MSDADISKTLWGLYNVIGTQFPALFFSAVLPEVSLL